MTDFLSWELIGTFAGFVLVITLMTEFLKVVPYLNKVPTQITSFVVALIVMVVFKIATKEFAWIDFLLYVVNSVGASLASNGAYDAATKILNPVVPPQDDETDSDKTII